MPTPLVIDQQHARHLLGQLDVPQILRKLFRDLAAGEAVQPSATGGIPRRARRLHQLWRGAGRERVYGIKTSLHRPRAGPLVTAWTLLMSMDSGQPLLLCDAGELTTARTAATTAVAVDALAPPRPGAWP
jgi:L-arginine dehydrogenase